MFLGPAIWIDGFANFEYISVSTIDLLGPGQHSFQILKCTIHHEKLFLDVTQFQLPEGGKGVWNSIS